MADMMADGLTFYITTDFPSFKKKTLKGVPRYRVVFLVNL